MAEPGNVNHPPSFTKLWARVALLLAATSLAFLGACELEGLDEEYEDRFETEVPAVYEDSCAQATRTEGTFWAQVEGTGWMHPTFCTYTCVYYDCAGYTTKEDCERLGSAACGSGDSTESEPTGPHGEEPVEDDGFSDYPVGDESGDLEPCQKCRSLMKMAEMSPLNPELKVMAQDYCMAHDCT